MRKRIFRAMSFLTIFSIMAVACISTLMDYRYFDKRIRADAENIVDFIRKSVEEFGIDFLKEMDNHSDYRITYISPEGDVLYDSEVADEEWKDLQNHKNRPEVASAKENGTGTAERYSDTMSVKTYYYAQQLKDGTILRVALEQKSEFQQMVELLPELGAIILVVLLVSFLISQYQTRKIVEPINRINFDNNEELLMKEPVYEELYPFIRKISRQRMVIEEQMRDIRSSKGEFEAITQNMSEGLIVLDKDENVLSYNKSVMELLEINETTGRLRNLVVFNRNETILHLAEQALKGERSEDNIDIGQRVYQVIASPVLIDGEINGAVILIIDETEKELRDELRREFSANVSHELKTPLTSISGYAEIMKSGMVKDEDMLTFAGIIHDEALRMIHLVEDIIKISKLDEHQVEPEKEWVDLLELTKLNISHLQKEADKKQILILIEGNGGRVYGIRQILDEMIHNLLENAIKYNKQQGKVMLSIHTNTEASPQTVCLSVKDTGIGIPKEDTERVFERFYRVDKSHSRKIGGTGLGLSIVKHGAIYHGAKIELKSEMDEGTEIKIIFPSQS